MEIIEIISSPEGQGWLEANLEVDPAQAALRAAGSPHIRAILAAQLKYLQRARKKLPTWYQARCIIPPLAFEQCSGEAAALLKPRGKGKACLDLTCGLGVDSWAFSLAYEKVTALEPDPERAGIANYNFARLGCSNIEVINTTAEEFLAKNQEKFDLVIVDPSRRDDSGRKFLFEDCQPNVLEIQEHILSISPELIIKASPLFDLEEGFRKLKNVQRAEVVSMNGEVKEVLFTLVTDLSEQPVVVATMERNGQQFSISRKKEDNPPPLTSLEGEPEFILEPDVAIYKASLVTELQKDLAKEIPSRLFHAQGYLYAQERPKTFPGRIFKILESHPFKPAQLKKLLKEKGIKKAWIGKRNFDLSVKDLYKKLKLKEGGTHTHLFSKGQNGELTCHFVERIG